MRTTFLAPLLGASLLGAGLLVSFAASPRVLAQETEGAPKSDIPADTKIETTATGLKYSVLEKGPGSGPNPGKADVVTVHYTGWTTDGKKFDSSRDRGEPTSFPLGGVIAGWTEGLQLMKQGDRFKFTIPADLAYGSRPPPGSGIAPDSTLIFDVQLLDVVHFEALDDSAAKTEAGLQYKLVAAGDGAVPAKDDTVEFRYALWNEKGKLLDHSYKGGPNPKAPLGQINVKVLPAAMALLKTGGRVLCKAPPAFGFGDQARGPDLPANSTTYWFIELVNVTKPLPLPKFEMPEDEKLTTTASGLKYEVLEKGDPDGTSPRLGQFVTVHYAGWLTDGTVFDSSYSRGETMSFQLGRVIKGWNEGLALMKPGDVYRFVIPADLAYGAQASGKIPPNSTLVFHVKLIRNGR